MHQGKRILAIIPARGGSKRLPRKNLLQLGGKPLIAWTIEAALSCPYIDEVMVTTDDYEIAEVSKKHGAKVPFLRPDELAGDNATSFDAVKHTIDFYQAELDRSRIWFFVATLRSFEHLAFDRAFDPKANKFEFFVPQDNIVFFEKLMLMYQQKNIIISFCKAENRLKN